MKQSWLSEDFKGFGRARHETCQSISVISHCIRCDWYKKFGQAGKHAWCNVCGVFCLSGESQMVCDVQTSPDEWNHMLLSGMSACDTLPFLAKRGLNIKNIECQSTSSIVQQTVLLMQYLNASPEFLWLCLCRYSFIFEGFKPQWVFKQCMLCIGMSRNSFNTQNCPPANLLGAANRQRCQDSCPYVCHHWSQHQISRNGLISERAHGGTHWDWCRTFTKDCLLLEQLLYKPQLTEHLQYCHFWSHHVLTAICIYKNCDTFQVYGIPWNVWCACEPHTREINDVCLCRALNYQELPACCKVLSSCRSGWQRISGMHAVCLMIHCTNPSCGFTSVQFEKYPIAICLYFTCHLTSSVCSGSKCCCCDIFWTLTSIWCCK